MRGRGVFLEVYRKFCQQSYHIAQVSLEIILLPQPPHAVAIEKATKQTLELVFSDEDVNLLRNLILKVQFILE